MDTVQTVARRAAAAGLALVARHRGVVEVIATGALQQVAAGTGHVAQLRRRPGEDGLGQQRVTLLDQRVPGQVGVTHQRTDTQAPLGGLLNVMQRQAGDVDQVLGMADVFFHQVQQVGATGDKA